jgi:hypothetical protein
MAFGIFDLHYRLVRTAFIFCLLHSALVYTGLKTPDNTRPSLGKSSATAFLVTAER